MVGIDDPKRNRCHTRIFDKGTEDKAERCPRRVVDARDCDRDAPLACVADAVLHRVGEGVLNNLPLS